MRRLSAAAVPAHAFPAAPDCQPGQLPQRDFDLGRSLGLLPGGGPPPAATAALLTTGDRRDDWLRAGQALHRLLAHAASKWVFASLHTQPLELQPIRALIRGRLALPGYPADAPAARPRPHHPRHRPPAARRPHRTLRSARWRKSPATAPAHAPYGPRPGVAQPSGHPRATR
jgi:hypothetical protein